LAFSQGYSRDEVMGPWPAESANRVCSNKVDCGTSISVIARTAIDTMILRVLVYIKQRGFSTFFRRLVMLPIRLLFQNQKVILFQVRPCIRPPSAILPVVELCQDDLPQMLRVMYASAGELRNRFRQKDRCFAVVNSAKRIAVLRWSRRRLYSASYGSTRPSQSGCRSWASHSP
jgi:hypothetical protein